MSGKSKVDLTQAYDLLHQADEAMSTLHGVDYDDPKSHRNNTTENSREHKARVSRELQHLEFLLSAAVTEVRRQYWEGKGYR
jgi:hypothetical protein